MGVMVEGSSRWSFAPLWYGELRVQDEPAPEANPQLRPPRFSENDFGASSCESTASMSMSELGSVLEEGDEEEEEEGDGEEGGEERATKQPPPSLGVASKIFVVASANKVSNPLMGGAPSPSSLELAKATSHVTTV
jgi:hypothetical protein